MAKKNFICTADTTAASELTKCGFTLFSKEGSKYTFLNNSTLKFDDTTQKDLLSKVCYTNILCV